MDTSTNKQIVKSGYEKFLAGDVEGLFALFTDDIELITPNVAGAQFYGTHRGREHVQAFFGALAAHEDFLRYEPEEFIAENDKVVVVGRSTTRVKTTGTSYETAWVHILTLRDGKVARLLEFFDNAKAERAYQPAEIGR